MDLKIGQGEAGDATGIGALARFAPVPQQDQLRTGGPRHDRATDTEGGLEPAMDAAALWDPGCRWLVHVLSRCRG
jgi:hypothetical protein